MKLFATTKYLFTVLLYCFALDSSPAFAAKKEDSKYTGPALVFNQPFGWYMNELEKCFAFNRRKFENEVAKYSWEDFKNLRSGSQTNSGCYDRTEALKTRKLIERKLEQLKSAINTREKANSAQTAENQRREQKRKETERLKRQAASASNENVCLNAVEVDKKTNLIIWTDRQDKQAYRAEARQRYLDCDVGQEELVLLKKQFSTFNDQFLCAIAKKKKNDKHWSNNQIEAAACMVAEKNITCPGSAVCESNAELLARLEEERKAAEAARLAEEEKKKKAAEAARLAEEEKKKKAAEAARLAEEEKKKKAAEAARLAKEAKEKRKKLENDIKMARSEAANLYPDIAGYVQTSENVDLLTFSRIFDEKPDLEKTWGSKELDKYLKLKSEHFNDFEFKVFHENQKLVRREQYQVAREKMLLALKEEKVNLENLLRKNFGNETGRQSSDLLLELEELIEKIDEKVNNEINATLQKISKFTGKMIGELKEKEKLIATFETKKTKLMNIIKTKFGKPIATEASKLIGAIDASADKNLSTLTKLNSDIETIIAIDESQSLTSAPTIDAPQNNIQSAASNSASPPKPNIQMHAVQEQFIAIVLKSIVDAKGAQNDMQKGGILSSRNNEICKILPSLNVKNWIGTVKKVDSNSDGKGVLYVSIAKDVSVQTWNNALSDIFDKTLLEPNSAIFNKASNLKTGQKVQFDGNFFSDEEKCVQESSITLDGKLDEPEFVFKFHDINPLD